MGYLQQHRSDQDSIIENNIFSIFFNFVLMGKSDQHKKLLERSGEKTLDFLIGAVWEGMSQKRDTQNSPYTMQASRVSFNLGVYRVKKKKTFISIFPPNWAIL